MQAEKKCEIIVKALDSKKGLDIQLIKVSDITALTEYFVLATGTSSTQVRALAEEAEFQMSQAGVEPHEDVQLCAARRDGATGMFSISAELI